ncbi:MAG: DsbA family oxidoreductase, partial [Alphaproteobacteria bacterium]|nr:DsbA family oxidoreductase [Alphaproteobacteria bacterium]
TYNFFDGMRIYNTAKAHQLLHWAGLQRKQTELKLAMFEAYFSNKANLEDPETLLDIAESCGLDRDKASEILTEDRYLDQIRDEETKWRHMGITGVPATILENQYLISGAQEPAYFQRALEQLISDLQSGKVG